MWIIKGFFLFFLMPLSFADLNYKVTAAQQGKAKKASDWGVWTLFTLFYDPSGVPDREMGNKTKQVHIPPGAMGPGRMRYTMEVNLAFSKAFLRRNLQGWMPYLATDSQGPTIQQRKCLAFSQPDARPVKWNLKRLTHWLWLPASPVIVWKQALAEKGSGRMKKMKFLNSAHQGFFDAKRKLSNHVISEAGQLAFKENT